MVIPDPSSASELITDHISTNLAVIAQTNAKTAPSSYTVSGVAEAYFGDGRQAVRNLNAIQSDDRDELIEEVRTWATEQFAALAQLEAENP